MKKKRTIIKTPTVHFGARIPLKMHGRLVRYAKDNDIKLTTLLRQILPEWLGMKGY